MSLVRFQIRDLRRELAAKALETREWQRKAEHQATSIARMHRSKANPPSCSSIAAPSHNWISNLKLQLDTFDLDEFQSELTCIRLRRDHFFRRAKAGGAAGASAGGAGGGTGGG